MAAGIDVREPADEDELRRAWTMLSESFNWPRADADKWLANIGPLERCRVAMTTGAGDRGGQVAAFSRVRPFGQFFGGRSIPMAGYSPVGVGAEFRGRGLASVITADHYPVLRERGEVLAGLYPATTRLYRSVGFELGAVWSERRFPIRSLQLIPPASGVAVRRAQREDMPAIQDCYAAHAATHPGWLERPAVWWHRILEEVWDDRYVFVIDAEGGGIAGYIVYRQSADPDRHFGYRINVVDLVADEVEVAVALWRLVGSASSLVDTVTVLGPPEHPLLFLLREQDIEPVQEIRYMLRVVDAAGAVARRGFPPISVTVGLEITDHDCDWNAGRWQLVIEEGNGRLVKSRGRSGATRSGGRGAGADVGITVNGFASLFSGYASARTLARAGLLTGAGDRELAALDAAFSGPTPWLPDFF